MSCFCCSSRDFKGSYVRSVNIRFIVVTRPPAVIVGEGNRHLEITHKAVVEFLQSSNKTCSLDVIER